MKVTPDSLLSFYLTGSVKPKTISRLDSACPYSEEELSEMEMSLKEWDSSKNSFTFKNPVFNYHTNWDSFQGYMRNSGLGVFDSLFSGIGSGITRNLAFSSGVKLAGLSLFTAYLSQKEKIPFLSKEFSLFNFGGRLIRAPLHIFDSAFSQIGEKGSHFIFPSVLAGAGSLFGLSRILTDKSSNDFELPNTTIAGTAGRTAMHHIESMLASKAANLFNANETTGSFCAGLLASFGLSAPELLKEKKLPFRTFEGMASQGGFHFLDSLFSGIGNAFSRHINTPLKLLAAGTGLLTALPVLGQIKQIKNFNASYSKFGGRFVRSILHSVETLTYNLGNFFGNTSFGFLSSLGFIGLTAFSSFSKQGKKLFKTIKVPVGTVGGQLNRIPFDFIYSAISASALQAGKIIPAPFLVLFGPLLSFKLGECFKNTSTSYTDAKGLMIRNSVHFLETMLSNAAFKTGRGLTGVCANDAENSGSVLSDGRWLTSEGQIVPTMAIGKQMRNESESSLEGVISGTIGGIICGILGSLVAGKISSFNLKRPVLIKEQSKDILPVCIRENCKGEKIWQ